MRKEHFVGTWRLVSVERQSPTSDVTYPMGVLMYDANGKMAVQVMNPDRPAFATGDRLNATPDEIQSAYASYTAYYGSYEVSDTEKIVTHHIEGSLFPNWIGGPQQRSFEFSDNRLTLSLIGPGNMRVAVVWQRTT